MKMKHMILTWSPLVAISYTDVLWDVDNNIADQ
jgi:hypothetical protein